MRWFCLSHQLWKACSRRALMGLLLPSMLLFSIILTLLSGKQGSIAEQSGKAPCGSVEARSLYNQWLWCQPIENELVQIKFYDLTNQKLVSVTFSSKFFKNLVKVAKLVLTLSHGQASVERGFSINKSILETNMKEESIIARNLIRDHILPHSLSPESFIITKHSSYPVLVLRGNIRNILSL